MIPFDRIAQWAEALAEAGLGELEVEEDGVRLRLVRRAAPHPPAAPPAAPAAAPEAEPEGAPGSGAADRTIVVAHRVGIFRRAVSPHGRPFAAGDAVAEGEVLGEVRVLDVPYEVRAPVEGVLVEVLAEDGVGVEFGQPLFVLEPHRRRLLR